MVELCNVTKKFGKKTAVDGISFKISEGEIVGLLGPNGAGKTTTMNLMAGCMAPDSGSIIVNGVDLLKKPVEAKRSIGYLPETPPLYQDMTVREYLDFVCRIKKPGESTLKQVQQKTELCGLGSVQDRLIRHLSKGYRQRVGLAGALLGDPELVVLDEPTVGLDPKQIADMRRVIKDLQGKSAVVFSSHILSEISAVCRRVLIINGGRIVADSPTEQIDGTLEEAFIRAVKEDEE